MVPKISIIVPIYNIEKYLRKCLDSILVQTFTNFELLLINDGSNDASAGICDEYKKKDTRVRVFHKENGGVSSARNMGLDNAVGEYIGFIDSDDFIEQNMYEMLYNDLINHKADISVCGIKGFYKTGEYIPYNLGSFEVYDTEGALKNVLNTRLTAGPTNKLYKKELFDDIRYPEGKIYEDALITPLVVSKAKTVVYNPEMKYYYFHRSGSITTKKFSMKTFAVVENYTQHLEMVKKKFPNLITEAYLRYFMAYFEVLDRMIFSEKMDYKKEYKEVISLLRKNIFKILLNPYFSVNRKLAAVALFFSDKIYKKIKIWYVNKYYRPFDN